MRGAARFSTDLRYIGICFLAVAGIGAAALPACTQPSQGKIAFSSDGSIVVVAPDGTGQVRITGGRASGHRDDHPSWSPDGKKIVFNSFRQGNGDIFAVNADGSGETRLTDHPALDFGPSWSPDGRQIVFCSDRDSWQAQSRTTETYIMDADGSNPRRLTNNHRNEGHASWSPDGSKVVYSSSSTATGNPEIFVMNADGTNLVKLTDSGPAYRPIYHSRSPSWSPDGKKIAFESNRADGDMEIYVMNADGSNQTRLTSSKGGDMMASWSPDGKRIVFVSYRGGTREQSFIEIYVMNADGSGQRRLTDNQAYDFWPAWSR